MNKIQFVRYYPGTVFSDTIYLTPMAELAHRRLCDFIWSKNHSPKNDDCTLAAISKLNRIVWKSVKRELVSYGWKTRQGCFTHPTPLAILRAAKELHSSATARGRQGALDRWRDSSAIAQPSVSHKLNDATLKVSTKRKRTLALNVKALSASSKESGDSAEGRFLADVMQVINAWRPGAASEELGRWGGWWRNRHRESPDKARRVLAEINALVKASQITSSPGRAAQDLWRRFH